VEVTLLDATWFLPKFERSGKKEFLGEHLPGAQFFDYDRVICDQNSDLPRMMPSVDVFSKEVCALGVKQDRPVVVYDNNGLFSSPRAWWMFVAMGHTQVAVLDGGLQAWKEQGFPTTSELTTTHTGDFVATPNAEGFVDAKMVEERLAGAGHTVLDARAEERFKASHMPGALNLPYKKLLVEDRLASAEDCRAWFKERVDRETQFTFSCGSGVTACVLALAARRAGLKNLSVYDGSWSEWGASERWPKVSESE
jgi:thiosulfate/3-mercaptopyruvate sulfurtransferase